MFKFFYMLCFTRDSYLFLTDKHQNIRLIQHNVVFNEYVSPATSTPFQLSCQIFMSGPTWVVSSLCIIEILKHNDK